MNQDLELGLSPALRLVELQVGAIVALPGETQDVALALTGVNADLEGQQQVS